jgi:hypothetical protein
MTALLSILAVALVFALSAYFAGRGCGDGCDTCRSCGWFRETDHGHRP